MGGAVADLSRSHAAWVSVRDCTCSFSFHTRNLDMALRGAGDGSAERVTKRQRTRSAHLPLYLAGKRAAAESPLRKSHSIQFRQKFLNRPNLNRRPIWSDSPCQCAVSRTCAMVLSGCCQFCQLGSRLTQHMSAAPHRLNEFIATRCAGELLTEFENEDVDDLAFGLVHTAVEMVEEHVFGDGYVFAQRQQLQHLILLVGQVHARAVDLDRLVIEIDDQVAGLDNGPGVALRAAHDRVDAGY